MRSISIFTLLLLGICSFSTPASAITWGEPDTRHTNVCAMVLGYPDGYFMMCSGVLIHPKIVLTAGHCTSRYEEFGMGTLYVNFDPDGLNAAHKYLPLPTHVRVINLENRRSLILRVNDRGPFVSGRIIDVSAGAAKKLVFYKKGTAHVRVEAVELKG